MLKHGKEKTQYAWLPSIFLTILDAFIKDHHRHVLTFPTSAEMHELKWQFMYQTRLSNYASWNKIITHDSILQAKSIVMWAWYVWQKISEICWYLIIKWMLGLPVKILWKKKNTPVSRKVTMSNLTAHYHWWHCHYVNKRWHSSINPSGCTQLSLKNGQRYSILSLWENIWCDTFFIQEKCFITCFLSFCGSKLVALLRTILLHHLCKMSRHFIFKVEFPLST